jgi:type IV pilus assembly protein PilA
MTNRGRGERGVTLIELLIVVAIIGILASVAVYMYTKTTRKAKSSEVPAVMAEFKMRQEQYHMENGVYLSTGDEDTMFPATPAGPDTPQSIAGPPSEWTSLKLNPDYTALYCSYVSVAGAGGDDTGLGAKAAEFGMTAAPATNWFYVLAKCDFNSEPGDNSYYFMRNDIAGTASQDVGK